MNRRIKTIFLSPGNLLAAFTGPKGLQFVNKITFPALPADYEVVGQVWWDNLRMAWGITVAHPSFPEVPEGQCIDEIKSWHEIVQLHSELNGKFISDKVPVIEAGDCLISRESSKSIDTLRAINGGKTSESHLRSLIEHAERKCKENEIQNELKKHKEELKKHKEELEDEEPKDTDYYINLIKAKLASLETK